MFVRVRALCRVLWTFGAVWLAWCVFAFVKGMVVLAKVIACPPTRAQRHRMHEAFVRACGTGDLPSVALLVSSGTVDLHGHNDAAFREACVRGQADVVEYLIRQDPGHVHSVPPTAPAHTEACVRRAYRMYRPWYAKKAWLTSTQ